MASFPDSVKVFTTKLDGAGNPINAAHVNDLQDEVNAIEAGYINGTAPLNSSRSTVATLSVTGASTFTVRPLWPIPQAVQVYAQSSITLGSSADSTIAWLSQQIVQNSSMHSTATNPQRLIPQSTGLYSITAQIVLSGVLGASTGYRQAIIEDSSGGIVGRQTANPSTATLTVLQATGFKRFDAIGGYVTLRVNQVGADTMSLSSGLEASWFAMHLL